MLEGNPLRAGKLIGFLCFFLPEFVLVLIVTS
jgi:hypothetical protein